MLETWFKKLFSKNNLAPPREVPRDPERRAKRLEAEKQTLRTMRHLAVDESDPQFLSYVVKREAELDRLIEAQLEDEFDVMTAKQEK